MSVKFEINYPQSLQELVNNILSSHKIYDDVLSFFNLENFRPIMVNLFETKTDFIEFLKKIKSGDFEMPAYCKASFDKGMINLAVSEYKDPNKRCLYTINHELIKLILKEKVCDKRVNWFVEGLAKNLSGEKNTLKTEKEFKKFLKNEINPNVIIKMNNLEEEDVKFVNENYNGYNLSYISVRYLLETMKKSEFLNLAKSYDKQIEIGETVLKDALIYYGFFNKKNIAD